MTTAHFDNNTIIITIISSTTTISVTTASKVTQVSIKGIISPLSGLSGAIIYDVSHYVTKVAIWTHSNWVMHISTSSAQSHYLNHCWLIFNNHSTICNAFDILKVQIMACHLFSTSAGLLLIVTELCAMLLIYWINKAINLPVDNGIPSGDNLSAGTVMTMKLVMILPMGLVSVSQSLDVLQTDMESFSPMPSWFDTLRPRQNGHHFSDDILKWIFFNKNLWISIRISLSLFLRGQLTIF